MLFIFVAVFLGLGSQSGNSAETEDDKVKRRNKESAATEKAHLANRFRASGYDGYELPHELKTVNFH